MQRWLHLRGYGKYAARFRWERVTGEKLAIVRHERLCDHFGVRKLGVRMRLVAAITELGRAVDFFGAPRGSLVRESMVAAAADAAAAAGSRRDDGDRALERRQCQRPDDAAVLGEWFNTTRGGSSGGGGWAADPRALDDIRRRLARGEPVHIEVH